MTVDLGGRSTDGPIIDAIERGLADTRASRIVSRATMSEAMRVLLGGRSADDKAATLSDERPVIWTLAARDTVLESLRAAAKTDTAGATAFADRLDRAALLLATAARGRPGRVSFTYETTQAAPPNTLVFEIVTWTKAGDVIAILAVVEDPHGPVGEEPSIVW